LLISPPEKQQIVAELEFELEQQPRAVTGKASANARCAINIIIRSGRQTVPISPSSARGAIAIVEDQREQCARRGMRSASIGISLSLFI